MDAIPWYRSPVFVSLVVAFVVQTARVFHISRFATEADAQQLVDWGLNFATLISLGVGLFKRYTSKVQPLAISKPSAIAKNLPQCHPITVALSLAAATMLIGCAQLGVQAAQTTEQKAAALLGDFGIFQKAALKIGEDPTVPAQVRKQVLDAPIALKPAVDQLDEALRTYREISLQLKAGQTTDEKLRIASANLLDWVTRVTPQIKSLRATIEGAHP